MDKQQNKDWTGNSGSLYKILGASNHTKEIRQKEDYYATEPKATELLLSVEKFHNNIWECACGEGHISKVLADKGYTVRSTDLVERGYGTQRDFLFFNTETWIGDIITNPPYAFATQFVRRSMEIILDGYKLAMFLKVQFLEGKERKKLFEKYPPKVIYISSSRLTCAKNGEFQKMKEGGGSAVAYAWFVWVKGYTGETILKWIN